MEAAGAGLAGGVECTVGCGLAGFEVTGEAAAFGARLGVGIGLTSGTCQANFFS